MKILNKHTGAVIYENAEIDSIKALVREAVYAGVSLRYADFRSTNLNGVVAVHTGMSLRYADFSWADFRGANLRGADFRWACLRHADFRGANIIEADFRGANLGSADLPHPICQFYFGEYHAVAQPHELRIGCEVHSWDIWLERYEEIGRGARMSETDIELHRQIIHVLHSKFKENSK